MPLLGLMLCTSLTRSPCTQVGLDRPREVIDGDGGQDLQSARREPTVKLAIRSFADSPERTKLRQEIDAAKAEIDQLQVRRMRTRSERSTTAAEERSDRAQCWRP
eukprot:1141043-Rhodomonas_salina.3